MSLESAAVVVALVTLGLVLFVLLSLLVDPFSFGTSHGHEKFPLDMGRRGAKP